MVPLLFDVVDTSFTSQRLIIHILHTYFKYRKNMSLKKYFTL